MRSENARDRAKAKVAGNKKRAFIRRSMELAAANAETAIKHDSSEAKEKAAQIRQLAVELTADEQSGASLVTGTPPAGKAARYRELEEKLRRHDGIVGKRREREQG